MLADKTALRSQLRALRRRLAAEHPDAAHAAATHWPRERFAAAKVVALYHPAGSEIDPTPLRTRIAAGHVALPVAASRQGALVFRLHKTGQALVPDAPEFFRPFIPRNRAIAELLLAGDRAAAAAELKAYLAEAERLIRAGIGTA